MYSLTKKKVRKNLFFTLLIKRNKKTLSGTDSASRTRTYDIMINSHALLPTELWRKNIKAWQRPTLAGRNPQLLSALRSLTSVFEMGTGVSFLPSSPHFISEKTFVLSKLNLYPTPSIYQLYNSWLSPRPISTSPLHASRHFHF